MIIILIISPNRPSSVLENNLRLPKLISKNLQIGKPNKAKVDPAITILMSIKPNTIIVRKMENKIIAVVRRFLSSLSLKNGINFVYTLPLGLCLLQVNY